MKAGTLDQRVTFQRRVVVQDAYGQDTITWTDIATVWAQCHALRGREFFAAAQTQMETSVKVRVRYRADIDQTCRMVWDGKNHDITGVIPVGRKDMLELICMQGVKDGR
jgi:SPP1 family predicted phage head-tail adaptor